MSFFTEYLSDAQTAHVATGVLTSVILAQWADETGYGGSKAFVSGNNFAGVSAGGGVNTFATKAKGLDAYINALNQSIYNPVRQAVGWRAQAVALGVSPWAGARYNAKAYNAGARCTFSNQGSTCPTLLANAGIDLINIIQSNNLTQFDSASTNNPSSGSTAVTPGTSIVPPAFGFTSNIANGDITINGTTLDVNVLAALVTPELNLSISQASTLTLTLDDPDRILIPQAIFQEKSLVALGGLIGLQFELVSVDKQDDVLTVIFEAYIVAALRTATGAIVVAPGQMSRTEFAKLLVGQIAGSTFSQAPASYLKTIGYDINSREQLSRGTQDAPLEDSWTCLQRLASEIQWVCFESFGTVYFGPYSWLAAQSPVMQPVERTGGIDTINGTYDVGQPIGNITISAKADSWIPTCGQAVLIQKLGPFNGTWIVAEMDRPNLMEPDITITLMQPQPSLPEPSTGGAAAAVGAGTVNPTAPQTAGGSTAGQGAVAYCVKQLGKPYVWGGVGPNGFDCSGLVEKAYESVGIEITRTTYTQWPTAAGSKVPPGIANLKPGDLVYFAATLTVAPEHVAIVTTINQATNVVSLIEAPHTGDVVKRTTMSATIGAHFGSSLVYIGALRPAP